MNYSNTFKWLHAVWNVDSPAADEVIEETVETIIDEQRTQWTLTIHLKGGRSLSMRVWVDGDMDIVDHTLWKGLNEWLNNVEDNTPCSFNINGYYTCIVKSEVTQLELRVDGK